MGPKEKRYKMVQNLMCPKQVLQKQRIFFMSFANRKLTGSLPSLFVSNGALQIPGVSLDSEKHPASRKGGVWRIPGFVDCMIDQGSEKETMAMW